MPKVAITSDVIGLAKPRLDAHMLGISRVDELLQACGFKTVVAGEAVCEALCDPADADNSSLIRKWLRVNRIGIFCFSYRLGAADAVDIFGKLMYQLEFHGLLAKGGGAIKAVYFASLPSACDAVKRIYADGVGVFRGDETPADTLAIMGIDPSLAPSDMVGVHPYDAALQSFGRDVVATGDWASVAPVDRQTSPAFGTKREKVVDRIEHGRQRGLPPLMRAHAGPYQPNRREAVKLFESWCRQLADVRLLDVLSIGTSQLTQARFGEDFSGRPNGGGVPINSPEEYERIWQVARPMLVRTYAGTRGIPALAAMHEETMNIAWHALSLWWFSRIDGRGPNSVLENLHEHFEALRLIASAGKPYEPNVSHHFAFRRADDLTYVVSAVLAARAAKRLGIRDLILQIMLNDPKCTWGVNDLAKARATLSLVRELEDSNFRVYLQTRAGLDYLSHRFAKAKAQLAAVTALMDDIEPDNPRSPDIIHVVSYSEGSDLATPEIINDSVRITRYALDRYRLLRRRGQVDDMTCDGDVSERMSFLIQGARDVLATIEECVDFPYTPQGLYDIFRLGFLPVPQLMYCRDDFPEAVRWSTKARNGRVDVYEDDKPLLPRERMSQIEERIRSG
ncbi:MAG: cobalamin-binding protein [Actinobacteria bacterium]|nr:cobalamin-binding protein [Actinomycetota bacterium]